MTRKQSPAICDFCKNEIHPDDQSYTHEIEQKRPFNSNKRAKGRNADQCHPCFIKMCENGYKPDWKHEYLNPNWVAGSKKGTGKEYWLPLNVGTTEATEQKVIA